MSIYGVGSSSTTASSMSEMLAQLREKQQNSGDSGDFATSFISDHDTDGDDALSIGETDFSEEMFSSIDTDGDGTLSAEELAAEEEKRQSQGAFNMSMRGMMTTDEMAASLVSDLDTDGDGVLSSSELAMDADLFSEIDADGDGTLSAEEISADMQSRMEEMQDTVASMGANAEAVASEASGASGTAGASGSSEEEEYDELDLNEDGIVSADELRQAMMSGMLGGDELSGLGATSTESSSDGSGSTFMRRMADQAYTMSQMMGEAGSTASMTI